MGVLVQGDGSLPLSIQRTIFNLCVPLVLGFLAAVFWLLWCDLNADPRPNSTITLAYPNLTRTQPMRSHPALCHTGCASRPSVSVIFDHSAWIFSLDLDINIQASIETCVFRRYGLVSRGPVPRAHSRPDRRRLRPLGLTPAIV